MTPDYSEQSAKWLEKAGTNLWVQTGKTPEATVVQALIGIGYALLSVKFELDWANNNRRA